ncbi:UDP-N-acetylglucosamine 2-epimerase [Oligoflexia bacterium]|nr:UDP-N-acetylglucosamine 2-epimerase [Oligoflexia bacterium]
MRTIGVVTGARADYGLYLPILKAVKSDPELGLHLIVTGMHLSETFGHTIDEIVAGGFEVNEKVDIALDADTPVSITQSMGAALTKFGQAFSVVKPDILLLLGDRFEMFCAAATAMVFNIPVAHIHGGELTFGAIDDSFRHAITKLSHLHFVACETYAKRVIQLGEDPKRVIVSGAPGLDNVKQIELCSKKELEQKFGLALSEPPLLVTFHPVTLEYTETEKYFSALLAALKELNKPVIFTAPNADTGHRILVNMIQEFIKVFNNAWLVESFGTQGYLSMMTYAEAMVGNSSSGVIEAASFALPVVNIGTRQAGRMRGKNVIDVGYSAPEIIAGVQQATDPKFKESLAGLENPLGDGTAAEKIIAQLKAAKLDQQLLMKIFYDLPKE